MGIICKYIDELDKIHIYVYPQIIVSTTNYLI